MKNQIFIVGLGPGKIENMTGEALSAIKASDLIVGYTVYVDLIKPYFPEKEFLSTPMKAEVERAKLCFEKALSDKKTALICSGDAGVYGLASLMFQLQMENDLYKNVELTVISGVTAANSGAAVLGCPLNHDYCVISLSDLLTPWETIEKRLKAAILGDFAIALYNPSSRKRSDYLEKACQIMLDSGASPSRKCGFVENIAREGTKSGVCTLAELKTMKVNMFTTVFIGNSLTEVFKTENGDRLITKRGYRI